MSQDFIRKQKLGIQYNLKRMEIALKVNQRMIQRGRGKDYFHPKRKFDLDAFCKRMDYNQKKKQKNLEKLRQEQLRRFKEEFKPVKNQKTQEINKYQPSFNKKLKLLFKKYKNDREEAERLKQEKRDFELDNSETKSLNLKKYKKEDHVRADNFYQKNIQWNKKVQSANYYKKLQLLKAKKEKEKIPDHYFKPKINEKTKKMVSKSFRQRTVDFVKKRSTSIKRIEKEIYNHSFKSRIYKKSKNRSNRSFWE